MRTKSVNKGKTKQGYSLPPLVEELGKLEGTAPGLSSLEDINDSESAWPDMINRIAAAACREKPSEEIFRRIGEELGKMGLSSIFLIRDEDEKTLRPSGVTVSSNGVAVYPAGKNNSGKNGFAACDSEIISRVLSMGDIVLTSDPDNRLKQLFTEAIKDITAPTERLSYICAPLYNAAGVFGILAAAGQTIGKQTARNIGLLAHIASMSKRSHSLAKSAGELKEKIECLDKGFSSAVTALDKSLQDVVHALITPMNMRDPYTSGHQTRVTRLAVGIAEEMGLSQYRIDGLRLAASIHDIGKIVIPFEILNRPTRLSEAEFALIKTHPQVAYEMLSPISFRWPVAEIVRQHHERCDGSGYPRGLHACQILQEARILAVADVVEAMSSHRPYRASLGIDAALDEISGKAGILYDTEVVAACIRLLLIRNFSLGGNEVVSPWQSANPFTPVKNAQVYP